MDTHTSHCSLDYAVFCRGQNVFISARVQSHLDNISVFHTFYILQLVCVCNGGGGGVCFIWHIQNKTIYCILKFTNSFD